MKKFISLVAISINFLSHSHAQEIQPGPSNNTMKTAKPKLGIKAGFNIACVDGKTPDFSPRSKNGFTVSAFYGTPSKGLGYRTEIIFSRQGFSFDQNSQVQNVSQDYIYMPHLTTFTIAKCVQLQAGGQMGYLLNAKKTSGGNGNKEDQIVRYMNRFDYGAAAGIEIYPFKGLILGARYNISMGNRYKQYSEPSQGSQAPIPFPLPVNPQDFKGKNAVIHFMVGYRF